MATQLQIRRGTSAQVAAFTGAEGEVVVNTTNDSIHVNDGSTAGGFELARVDGSNWAITNAISTTANISFGDNDKAIFGSGGDLQIYHDGTHSVIEDAGTGNLILQSDGAQVSLQSTTELYLTAANNGAVTAYHNGSAKLATTSTGIDVTGTATMDGLVSAGTAFVNLTSRPAGVPATAGALWSAQTETGNYGIVSRASSTDSFTYIGNTGSAATLGTSYGSSGSYLPLDLQTSDKKRLSIASNGDISFYNSSGTSQSLHWDSSAESLGIGTSSPSSYGSGIVSYNTPITVVGNQYDGNLFDSMFFGGVSENLTYRNIIRNSLSATPTNQKMQFSVANGASTHADVMTLSGDGNVGIGTSSPNSYSGFTTLTLDGTSGSLLDLEVNGTVTGEIYADTSFGIGMQAIGSRDIQFKTNNTERMRIDAGGSVLIGKTTPTDLHNTWNHLIIGEKGAIISENGAGGIDGITVADNAYIDADTGSYAYQTTAAASKITQTGGVITFDNAASGTAGAALTLTERMRIDSSGNVGIGETSPSTYGKLVVTGSTPFAVLRSSDVTTAGFSMLVNSGSNGVGSIATDNGGHMTFDTGSTGASQTERMRIDASGNLLVGKSSATATNDNGINLWESGEIYTFSEGTTTRNQLRFYRDVDSTPTIVGSIATTGTATAYNTSSDQRLKENIADADDAGSKIDAIQVRKFDWIADGSHQDYGMVAQELQGVAPEAVTAPEDPEEMMGVDYSKLVPMLVKEIQSLRARVAQLENN